MTTPAAPSRYTAIWSPALSSMASRARKETPGSTSAHPPIPSVRKFWWRRNLRRFQGLAGPRGAADDLKKLTGVSGAIEKKFNDLGIFHYWQLAELDHDTAHKIGEEVGLPSRADGWVAQAKAMTAEAE